MAFGFVPLLALVLATGACLGTLLTLEIQSTVKLLMTCSVKVLERPGIEPGTIRYLDWMLYH